MREIWFAAEWKWDFSYADMNMELSNLKEERKYQLVIRGCQFFFVAYFLCSSWWSFASFSIHLSTILIHRELSLASAHHVLGILKQYHIRSFRQASRQLWGRCKHPSFAHEPVPAHEGHTAGLCQNPQASTGAIDPSCGFFFFFLMFIYFWEGDRAWARGTDPESKAGSRLWAVRTEPDVGLEPADCEITTWVQVRRLTHWATQAPRPQSCSWLLRCATC